jgi:hypothetical protein
MAVEEVLLERTPLPEQGIAVITRWWRITDDATECWRVGRKFMREVRDHDPLEHKETTLYAAEVTGPGRLKITRDKYGTARALGYAAYRFSDDGATVSAGHRTIVGAIESGRVRVHKNTGLTRCLHSLVGTPLTS